MSSDFGSLRQNQRIFHVDTKVSDRVLYLGVSEQYLDRADTPVALWIIDAFVRRSE